MAFKNVKKELGDETLLIEEFKKKMISSGIRELDDMIGGGFKPASLNLIQESIGCGGDILTYCIARANLNLSNKVLIIFSDPVSKYLVERLKTFSNLYADKMKEEQTNQHTNRGLEFSESLYILDLVKLSEQNITIMEDKHEIQLKIATAINQMINAIEKSGDELSEKIIIYLSLNPFLLKLDTSTLDILYNNLIDASKSNYVQIVLMQKDIISLELKAKIQSLCHLVCDLDVKNIGELTEYQIKILKHAGTNYDIKSEPYIIEFNRKLNRYDFLIRGAFLTSFETFRNLLQYKKGSLYIADAPFLIAPVNYFNVLLQMPLNLSLEAGEKEIHEKGQLIGRKLTITTKALYFLNDLDLLKATIRQLALFGFGNLEIDLYEKEENLLIVKINFHKEFHKDSYIILIKGILTGLIKRSIKRVVRSIEIVKIKEDNNYQKLDEYNYRINIRLEEI